MKKLRVLIGSVAAFAVLAIAGLLYIPHADAGQCLSSSVMKCGFTSTADMRNKYNSDDTPGTKNIYTYFGITSDIVNHYTTKDGTVTKNGDVYIGSEKVATGAMTADRIDIAGSNRATKRTYNGTTFYTRTTEIAPSRAASAKVIVFLNSNGEFAGAVVYDCGNPIKGNPVPKPKPPVYACNSLKATPVAGSRTNYTFATSASASNGAVIKDYSYNFGDGSSKTTGASTSHAYTKPGTYTVTVNVNVTVNGKTVVAPGSCKTSVTVKPEMCTVPGKEQYPKDDARCCVETVQACNLDTKKIETVDKSKIDNIHYTTDLTKCQPVEKVQACNLDTMKIETVEKSKIDNVHYTTDLSKCQKVEKVQACNLDTLKVEMVDKSKIDDVHYTTDLTKCAPKPETVVACNLTTGAIETVEKSKIDDVHYSTDLTKCQEQVCRISDKTIVTINKADFDNSIYTTDMSQCETTTPPVTELPHTGISDGIMSVIGAGSLVGMAGAYIASRRLTK